MRKSTESTLVPYSSSLDSEDKREFQSDGVVVRRRVILLWQGDPSDDIIECSEAMTLSIVRWMKSSESETQGIVVRPFDGNNIPTSVNSVQCSLLYVLKYAVLRSVCHDYYNRLLNIEYIPIYYAILLHKWHFFVVRLIFIQKTIKIQGGQ